jgi:hypothetical protein
MPELLRVLDVETAVLTSLTLVISILTNALFVFIGWVLATNLLNLSADTFFTKIVYQGGLTSMVNALFVGTQADHPLLQFTTIAMLLYQRTELLSCCVPFTALVNLTQIEL